MTRDARGSDDTGLGLVELLVAMMLTAVLLAVIGTFFVTTVRAASSAAQTREAATVAGNVANAVTGAVRFAAQNPVRGRSTPDPAIVEGGATSVTLHTLDSLGHAEPRLTRVRFSVVDGSWVEERWTGTTVDGYTTFPTGAAPSRRVLGGVADASVPPFTYLDAAGAELPVRTALTDAQRSSVASIRVVVRVRSAVSSTAPAAVIDSVVGMRNLGYVGAGS